MLTYPILEDPNVCAVVDDTVKVLSEEGTQAATKFFLSELHARGLYDKSVTQGKPNTRLSEWEMHVASRSKQ